MPTSIRDLPPIEQLAIEQALFSKLGEDVSTKNPDSLRSIADAEIIDNYHNVGAKSYDVHVNGQKVGTYSVRVAKEKKQQRFVVFDNARYAEWLNSADGIYYMLQYVGRNRDAFLKGVLEEDGTVPEGVAVDVVTVPESVSGTTLRIDAGKVETAISGYLSTSIAGLIGGGENGQ